MLTTASDMGTLSVGPTPLMIGTQLCPARYHPVKTSPTRVRWRVPVVPVAGSVVPAGGRDVPYCSVGSNCQLTLYTLKGVPPTIKLTQTPFCGGQFTSLKSTCASKLPWAKQRVWPPTLKSGGAPPPTLTLSVPPPCEKETKSGWPVPHHAQTCA